MTENRNELVYLKKWNEIAFIYINRIEKRNALSYKMWKQIPKLMEICATDPKIKVVIFKSVHHSTFSAGADIQDFEEMCQTREGAKKYNDAIVAAESAIKNLMKPTIAQIQGFCVGGGCEIAVACDFRFAHETSVFGITPAKLGLIYNTPGTKYLMDLIGPAKTKDLLYTGRLIEAGEALEIGLIDKMYTDAELEKETNAYAQIICKNAQLSIRGTKQIIQAIESGITQNTEEIENVIIDAFLSEDFHEGVNAFLNKRKANFKCS